MKGRDILLDLEIEGTSNIVISHEGVEFCCQVYKYNAEYAFCPSSNWNILLMDWWSLLKSEARYYFSRIMDFKSSCYKGLATIWNFCTHMQLLVGYNCGLSWPPPKFCSFISVVNGSDMFRNPIMEILATLLSILIFAWPFESELKACARSVART